MALLALLWGSGFLWIKIALNHGLSPLQITVARCVLGAAVLLALASASGLRLPRDRGTWGRLLVAAFLCNVLPFLLFAVGEQTVDSSVAGVLNATTPLWSLLIGIGLGGERGLGRVRLAGLLLGFAGTVLIFAPWRESGQLGPGALALLGAALSYAAAFVYMDRTLTGRGDEPPGCGAKAAPSARRAGQEGVSPSVLALAGAQLVAASGLSLAALPVTGGPVVPAGADATALVAVGVLGILGTGVTFYLNYRLIADEGATGAATVGYLLPVVSVALGALVLGEDIGLRVVLGMLVVLAGVAMTRGRGRQGGGGDGNGAVREEPAGAPPRDQPAARPGGAVSCR
jgi:drug/metabolite transporter (DMT)-like permease